jgi:hypothetical protein
MCLVTNGHDLKAKPLRDNAFQPRASTIQLSDLLDVTLSELWNVPPPADK